QEAAARLALLPPGRRRYVPREDFAAEFGAFPSDAEAMQRWLSAAGIEVGEIDLARRRLVARGSMRALAEAFGATLARYEREGRSYLAREGTLSLPASLHPMVVGVFGFDAREQARAQVRIARTASPTAYAPMRVARAYGFPATSASGATIGFVELGGGYDPAQLAAAFKALGATAPSVVAVSVDGANNAPSGDPNSADGEVQLDLEVAGTVALGAALVVYFGPNTDRGFLDAISAAIHDTQHAPSVVSISWGGPESNYTQQTLSAMDTALADGALLGVTITCAAGDGGSSDGASDGLAHADFPASSPHVLACGGTSLVLANGAIASETVWNDGASGGATGGGVSDVFSLPTWQAKAGVPPSANPGAHVGRGVPDVAASADPEFGYAVQIDGSPLVVGGTSAAAPLWAALIGLANAASGKHAGFVNALLYGAGEKIFRDIVSGNNGAYAADPGWDACTGLGSPQGASVTATLES
ncbi:MAG: S53 family peptidase, partial [Vulcanimicrobiaceae bacterium]